MVCKDVDVRVRDVDPLNSKIFKNGWMYVDYSRGFRNHRDFAPYFSNECPDPGISMISRVLCVMDCRAADLVNQSIELPGFPSEQHRAKWRLGLAAIRARANEENWQADNTSRLFYLDSPETFRTPALTKVMYNDTNPGKKLGPSRIPIGFTLTYGELLTKSTWALDEPPGFDQLG